MFAESSQFRLLLVIPNASVDEWPPVRPEREIDPQRFLRICPRPMSSIRLFRNLTSTIGSRCIHGALSRWRDKSDARRRIDGFHSVPGLAASRLRAPGDLILGMRTMVPSIRTPGSNSVEVLGYGEFFGSFAWKRDLRTFSLAFVGPDKRWMSGRANSIKNSWPGIPETR
jgi:hypothetical protein